MIVLRKKAETNTTITLEWDPVPEAVGYRFQSNLSAPKWSHTFDPGRTSVKFSKAASYKVEALGVEDSGQYPAVTSALPFAEAVLSNPIELTIPVVTDFLLPEAGRDYLIDMEKIPRQGLVLKEAAAGPPRNVHIINQHWRCTAPRVVGDSAYRRGGLRLQLRAKHISMTGYFCEVFGVSGCTMADGLGIACAPDTKVTLQKALIEGIEDSPEPDEHCDAVQIQGPVGRLEIGLSSLYLSGVRPPNHFGKGLQLAHEPWPPGVVADAIEVDIRKVDMEGLGVPGVSRSGMFMVQGDRNIAISMDEVYGSARDGANELDFPKWIWVHPIGTVPTVTGTKPNRASEFRDPATNIKGLFRERPVGTHFMSRVMLP